MVVGEQLRLPKIWAKLTLSLQKLRFSIASKLPRGGVKSKMTVFRQKVHLCRRKSATKFLYVKTVSDKVVGIRWDLSV